MFLFIDFLFYTFLKILFYKKTLEMDEIIIYYIYYLCFEKKYINYFIFKKKKIEF